MGLLERVTFLNRRQVARLAQAASLNSEVAEAFMVPARIDALIARAGQPDAG